jgi:hypothetical protein
MSKFGILRAYLPGEDEDDYIHVEEWAKTAADQQAAAARKFERIDRWGEGLTILMAVAGMLLGAFYLYQAWLQH